MHSFAFSTSLPFCTSAGTYIFLNIVGQSNVTGSPKTKNLCSHSMNIWYWSMMPSYPPWKPLSLFFPDDLPFPSLLSLCLLSCSPPNFLSMTLRVHQPRNCEQLLESELYTWLHIIFHLSVWILSLIYTAAWQSPTIEPMIDLCVCMRGLKLQRPTGAGLSSSRLNPLFLVSPPLAPRLHMLLSLWQGIPVELLCGSSSVSTDLDVSSARHHWSALHALSGDTHHNTSSC